MILFLTLNESESEMKSKLKNVCVVIERNIQIEKIVYENFYMLECKADKNYLENQIVGWSRFDEENEKERIFFMTYVLRYLSNEDNVKSVKKFN